MGWLQKEHRTIAFTENSPGADNHVKDLLETAGIYIEVNKKGDLSGSPFSTIMD